MQSQATCSALASSETQQQNLELDSKQLDDSKVHCVGDFSFQNYLSLE
jgi:hypothetical protein